MKVATHPAFFRASTGLASIGAFFRRALSHWNDRRTVHALAELDDYLLADIGLTRSDLDWALQQASSFLPSEELARRAREQRQRRNRRVI